MKYDTIARRIEIQTDRGVEADTPEAAAQLIGTHQSNASEVRHRVDNFFEVEVYDSTGALVGSFKLDQHHHIIRPRPVVKPEGFPFKEPPPTPPPTRPLDNFPDPVDKRPNAGTGPVPRQEALQSYQQKEK